MIGILPKISKRLAAFLIKNFLCVIFKITQMNVSKLNGMLSNLAREFWNVG